MNTEKGRLEELNSQRRELLASIKDLLAQNVWIPNSKYLASRWDILLQENIVLNLIIFLTSPMMWIIQNA